MSRYLDYCGVCALCGPEFADELFQRKLPAGFDLDQPGDEELVTAIVKEQLKCELCGHYYTCHKKHK